MKLRYVWVFFALITGCQVLTPPNTAATLQAEGRGYVETATSIQQQMNVQQTQVMATAEAANTRVADTQRVNQQLLAIVRANETPTVRTSGSDNPVVLPTGVGEGRWFVKTGTATSVRESDGCVEQTQIEFSVDTPRIYATVQAFNIEAGVEMSVAWFYEGTEMLREGWIVPQSASDLCIWFYMDRESVEFLPGSWSVRLFADGFQLEDAMVFSLTAMDEN